MEELLQQIEKNVLESMDDVVSLRILNFANIAGGLVCEEVGVVPINKTNLLDETLKLLT